MIDPRFTGIERLFGQAGLATLQNAHVAVVGVGGVGSWAVEALARSGVGRLTLIDLDEVCTTNINRQIHATDRTVGRAKIDVMAQRVALFAPQTQVICKQQFLTADSAEALLDVEPAIDVVIDAIDSAKHKTTLIAACRQRGLHVVTVGGAGGRTDPCAIRVADLAWSYHDTLLQMVRKRLRQMHSLPKKGDKPFGIPCVFSPQPVTYPTCDGQITNERPIDDRDKSMRLSCEQGFGAAVFVTGAMGFQAAALAVEHLLGIEPTPMPGPPDRRYVAR
jgi:tRNA A37 threonylcarbamoyladenosine dehydratase